MNHCESYEPLLDAFTEGDLFMEDMVWVQQHLNTCPDCQAYVEDLLSMRAAFPTVDDVVVPAGFTASVMAAVANTPQATAPVAAKAKKASAKKNTPWIKVLSGLAACCAIVLLAQGMPHLNGGSMAPKAEEAAPESEALYYTADSAAPIAAAEAKMAEPEADCAETPAEESVSMAPYRIIIEVDADYIGDLLDSYRPVMQYDEVLDMGSGNDTSVHTAEYELTIPEYDDLLIQLAKRNELPAEQLFDTTSAMVLIIVRQ